MKQFFYSYQKYQLCKKYIVPLTEKNITIHSIHTDCIKCKKNEFMDQFIGIEIGQLKYEN